MSTRGRWLLAVCLFIGCRGAPQVPGLENDTIAAIPPDTVAVAGVHLDRVRNTEFYRALPAAWTALLDPLSDATYVLLAFNGRDALLIARGEFRTAPAGSILLSPKLALAGAPRAVRSARQQYEKRQPEPIALLDRVKPIAEREIWAVVSGARPLPLSGNWENANRLLSLTDSVTLTAGLGLEAKVDIDGYCRTSDRARQLEESLRGLTSLAVATSHDPQLAGLLRAIRLERKDQVVHVELTASASAVGKLVEAGGSPR